MYLDYYNLREKPFNLTPDPAFLYHSQSHKKAIAFLKYGLQESKGFLQLTGPVGSGKTTLLRAILSQLDERTKTAYIFNPSAPFPHLLRSIMKDLEIPNIPETRVKLDLLDFFHEYLLVQARRSRPVVVIFDEAQNLGVKNLEEIRMLSNFETTKEKLLQIVFVGQPELIPILDLPELRQLKQRIQVRYHLAPLRRAEVKAYIEHRLSVAGSNGEVKFTDDACEAVYEFSEGIPRLINSVCDVALLIGYVNELKRLDAKVVKEATGEISGAFEDAEPESDLARAESQDSAEDAEEIKILRADAESDTGVDSPSDSGIYASPGEGPDPDGSGGKILAIQEEPAIEPADAGGKTENSNVATAPVTPPSDSAFPSGPGDETEETIEQTVFAAPPEAAIEEVSANVQWDESRHEPKEDSEQPDQYPEQSASHPQSTGEVQESRGKTGFRLRLKQILELIRADESLPAPAEAPTRKSYIRAESDHPLPATPERMATLEDFDPLARVMEWVEEFVSGFRDGLMRVTHALSSWRANWVSKKYLLSHGGRVVPEGFINSKIMVLMKDSTIVRGIAEDLDLHAESFHFVPLDKADDRRYLPYERMIAAKLIDHFDEPWKREFTSSGKSLKGRQVVVTLLNGEVVEGIALDRLNPESERFFVVSPGSDGNPSWVLVEKSGAAGIATEQFKTGIYAEECLEFWEIADACEGNALPTDAREKKGDLFFSLKDYRSALEEYERIPNGDDSPNRLHLKISLSHFNMAIQHLQDNRYVESRREFLIAAIQKHLNEKAVARIHLIDRLLNEGESN